MTEVEATKWMTFTSPIVVSPAGTCGLLTVNGGLVIKIQQFGSSKSEIPKSLFKYNTQTDTFQPYFNTSFASAASTYVFDTEQQKLYIGSHNRKFDQIDIKTGKHITLSHKWNSIFFLVINNYVYGIDSPNCYWIGLVENDVISELLFQIVEPDCYMRKEVPLKNGSAIHIPSKNCILLFHCSYGDTIELWLFSLTTKQWMNIDHIYFKSDIDVVKAVLPSNEDYVILFRSYNSINSYKSNDIIVLDIKDENISNWKVKQCEISFPGVRDDYDLFVGVARTGNNFKNDVLVHGFVRNCFKMEKFEDLQLPPLSVMKLITTWCDMEIIHFMYDCETESHYGIHVTDILSSLYD
eukprot:153624_1